MKRSGIGKGDTHREYAVSHRRERADIVIVGPNDLYFRDVNIVTSYSCGPDDTEKALELIANGTVRAEQLVTHRFSMEETASAYRTVAQAQDSLKVLIKFE